MSVKDNGPEKVSAHKQCWNVAGGGGVEFVKRTFIDCHCRISYCEGLGMSPRIMGLTTQDPYIQKEHTELYKLLKFRVNWANIDSHSKT